MPTLLLRRPVWVTPVWCCDKPDRNSWRKTCVFDIHTRSWWSLLYKERLRLLSASKRYSHARAPKWREIGQGAPRARNSDADGVLEKAASLRVSERTELNSAVGGLSVGLAFLLLHFNSDLISGDFKYTFFFFNRDQIVALCSVQRTRSASYTSWKRKQGELRYIFVAEFV